jgi:WD40 repeat protein
MNIATQRRHDRLEARPGLVHVIALLVVAMLGAACTQRSVECREGSRTRVISPSLDRVGGSSVDKATIPTPPSPGPYLVNLRTGEVTRLPVGRRLSWPDVSTDGRRIAWTEGFVSNVDGSNVHRVGVGGIRPEWSPDGMRIAFDSSTFRVDGSIFVVSLRSGDTCRVRTVGNAPYAADWSPDGTKILYLSPWGAEDREIRVVDLATGVDTRLRRVGGRDSPWDSATWSPDGRRIVFECDTGICVMRADGSNVQKLACCPMRDHGTQAPQWSPVGTTIAYWSDEDVPDVYVLDLTTGVERLIMESATAPVWAGQDMLIVAVARCHYEQDGSGGCTY